jgi:hypothetical protein
MHAVFISGLPKLPAEKQWGYPDLQDRRYNVFRYQWVSSVTSGPGLASDL